MRAPFSTAIAIAIGLVILAGYFIPNPALQNVRDALLGWGAILAGIAMLIGIWNLISVHWRKLRDPHQRDFYSLFTLLAFLTTFAAGLALGPNNAQFQHVVTSIQEPIEISLLAVLSVTLAYAALRLFQKRTGLMAVIFVLAAAFFLLIGTGLLAPLQSVPLIGDLLTLINRLPIAGMRGILLGVALGSLTAGLRILLGSDRPYSG